MSDSTFRGYGLHEDVDEKNVVNKLLGNYTASKKRQLRQGFFLGTDFLTELTGLLEREGYDGLYVRFGQSSGSAGKPPLLELVGTPIEFEGGDSMEITKWGPHYCSRGGMSTNPPSLPSPPLGGGGGGN